MPAQFQLLFGKQNQMRQDFIKNELMKRKISKSSFALKGGGWFKDGYSKPKQAPGKG